MVRSLGFLGVRTAAFAEMAAPYRDVLGLEPIVDQPGAAWFRAGPARAWSSRGSIAASPDRGAA